MINMPQSCIHAGFFCTNFKKLIIQQAIIQGVKSLVGIANPVNTIVRNTVQQESSDSRQRDKPSWAIHPSVICGVQVACTFVSRNVSDVTAWDIKLGLVVLFTRAWLCRTNLQALELLPLLNPAEGWKVLDKSLGCFKFEEFFCKRDKQD